MQAALKQLMGTRNTNPARYQSRSSLSRDNPNLGALYSRPSNGPPPDLIRPLKLFIHWFFLQKRISFEYRVVKKKIYLGQIMIEHVLTLNSFFLKMYFQKSKNRLLFHMP